MLCSCTRAVNVSGRSSRTVSSNNLLVSIFSLRRAMGAVPSRNPSMRMEEPILRRAFSSETAVSSAVKATVQMTLPFFCRSMVGGMLMERIWMLAPCSVPPVDENRSGDEEGGVGSDHRADNQGEDEPADTLCRKEEEHEEHDERASTGVQCARHCFLEAAVREHREVLPPVSSLVQVAADAVEDDDRIVYGVSHNTEECCDEERIQLKTCCVAEDRENSQSEEGVVEERQNGGDSEAPGAESSRYPPEDHCQIEDDCNGGYEQRPDRTLFQACAHSGSDCRELAFRYVPEFAFEVPEESEVLFVAEVAHTHEVTSVFCAGNSDVTEWCLSGECPKDSGECVFGDFFGGRDFHERSSSEINAQHRARDKQEHHTHEDESGGDRQEVFCRS